MINTIKATINLNNVCLDEVDLGNGVIYRGDDLATSLEIKAPINSNAYVLLACITPNGRNLGPFNADSTTSTSTATTYEFLLTKENGYNFAVGRTELIIYYCVVNTNSSISKKAIGSICVDVKKGVSVDDEATFIIGDTTDADAVLTDLNTKMDNLINQVATFSTQLSNKLDAVKNTVTLTNSGVLFTARVESGTDSTIQSQGRNGISSAVDSSTANNNDNRTATTTTLTITDKTSSKSTEQKQTANYVTIKATDGTNTKTLAISPQSININGEDVVVEDDLTAEATARQGADNTLQTNIDNEALARGNADTLLQANIDASGHKIEVLKDLSTYQYTFRLLDANDNVLSSQLIDLPIESMIINVSYDAINKDLIITLQSGTTLTVPLDDIISGLASQDWVTSQLSTKADASTTYTKNEVDTKLNAEKNYTDNIYTLATNNIAGKDTSTNILAKSSNSGIWVGTDTGHWYYWNGTQYVDGGVYQATEIDYQEYTNLINYDALMWGYYNDSGSIITAYNLISSIISVSANDVLYVNRTYTNFTVAFLDNNKDFISAITFTGSTFTIPNNSDIAYLSFPINTNQLDKIILSYNEIPYNTLVNNSNVTFGAFTGRYDVDKLINNIKDSFNDDRYTLVIEKYISTIGVKVNVTQQINKWDNIDFNTRYLKCINFNNYITLTYNNLYVYAIHTSSGKLYKFNRANDTFEVLHDFGVNFRYKIVNVTINEKGIVHINNGVTNALIVSFDINDYITLNDSYIISLGEAFIITTPNNTNYPHFIIYDLVPQSQIYYKTNNETNIDGSQWNGKTWYAYGTSLTSTSQGKYAPYLAQFSRMNLVNKGVAGGALVANRNIYNALMDNTDGKVNADLITIEVGPNDGSTPIGNPTDLTNTTFCGALNLCIKNLYENCPKAQIVIMCSHQSRYELNDPTDTFTIQTERAGGGTWFDLVEAVKKVATVQGCYYVNYVGVGLGLYRMLASNLYNVDQIHETSLGGYNIAKGLWAQIKNIPLWYNELPE